MCTSPERWGQSGRRASEAGGGDRDRAEDGFLGLQLGPGQREPLPPTHTLGFPLLGGTEPFKCPSLPGPPRSAPAQPAPAWDSVWGGQVACRGSGRGMRGHSPSVGHRLPNSCPPGTSEGTLFEGRVAADVLGIRVRDEIILDFVGTGVLSRERTGALGTQREGRRGEDRPCDSRAESAVAHLPAEGHKGHGCSQSWGTGLGQVLGQGLGRVPAWPTPQPAASGPWSCEGIVFSCPKPLVGGNWLQQPLELPCTNIYRVPLGSSGGDIETRPSVLWPVYAAARGFKGKCPRSRR